MKIPKGLIMVSTIALVMVLCPLILAVGVAAEGQSIGKKTYKGWIGNTSAILMMLEQKGNILHGGYRFPNTAKNHAELLGIMEKNGTFVLNESIKGKDTGFFRGTVGDDGSLTGSWSSLQTQKVLAFNLKESNGQELIPDKSKNTFTIQEIKTAEKNKVKLVLSEPFPALKYLFDSLPKPRVLPKVDIDISLDWPSISPKDSIFPTMNTVSMKGDFKEGTKYTVIWPKGMVFWGKKYIRTINQFVVKPEPKIEFFDDKRVIESHGRQMIHLKSNINTLLVEGVSVPPVLFPLFMERNHTEEIDVSGAKLKERFESILGKIKDVIGEESPFSSLFDNPVEANQAYHSEKSYKTVPVSLPLSFREDSQEGSLELIRIKDKLAGKKTATLYRLLRITDLGLTYKRSKKDLLVWTTSLKSGAPQKDIRLFAVDHKDRLIPLGSSDSNGVFMYRPIEKEQVSLSFNAGYQLQDIWRQNIKIEKKQHKLEVDEISYLLAVSDSDVSYIKLNGKQEFKPKNISFAWSDSDLPTELRGELFTERGIYRPGDRVHFKGVLRRFKEGRISPAIGKAIFTVDNSKGEEVLSSEQEISKFGTASGSLILEPHFPLGTYTVYMATKGESPIGHTFQLQEFRAPRHFTKIAFSKRKIKDKTFAGEDQSIEFLDITIDGGYYAGGPVKNGQVRWKIFQSGTQFRAKGHDSFKFGDSVSDKILLESSESILNEKGQLKVTFPIDSKVSSGQRSLEVVATVVDFDGRVASSKQKYQGEPNYLVGIGKHKKEIDDDESFRLPVMVVAKDGVYPEKSAVNITVFRKENNWVRKRNQKGETYWSRTDLWKKKFSTPVPLTDGKGVFEFNQGRYGEYSLTAVYKNGGKIFVSGTAFTVNSNHSSTDRGGDYETIELWSNKGVYKPGEKAVLDIYSRREVTNYLVTMEREGVLWHQVVPATGSSQKIELPLNISHSPNVYVSVLGTTARQNFPVYASSLDDGAPNFLFGTLSLSVLKESEQLEINIGEKSYELKGSPGSEVELDFTVNRKGNEGNKTFELAIGIVDERVLALTGYSTPNLRDLSKFTLPLRVKTADIRSILSHQTPLSKIWNFPMTGGDGLEKTPATQSTIRKDFNPVAYFNPSVITDSDGKATIKFVLPDTMTSYRVYVVACDQGGSFGSVDRQLLAVKDFYIEPGMPRFFTKGDKFNFLVSAFNKTDQEGQVEVDVVSAGGLNLSVANNQQLLHAHDSKKLVVEGEALHPGLTTTLFQGNMSHRTDAVQIKIPVNSGNTIETQVLLGAFKGKSNVTFPLPDIVTQTLHDDGFMQDASISLMMGTTPFIRIAEGLQYLMRYPYGCIEQTSSGVMPLAALRGLIKKGLVPGQRIQDVDEFLKSGVERLFRMKTESGGFGYWPGDTQPHKEGTLYALSALSVAKMNGLEIPEKPFKEALEYLKMEVRTGEHEESYLAFASYILSLNNMTGLDELPLKLAKLSSSSSESNYFWLLAGHHSNASTESHLKLWFNKYSKSGFENTSYGEFNNKHRVKAIALLAGTALNPDAVATGKIASELISSMDSRGIWNSTSDTGWALFALGNYFGESSGLDQSTTIHVALGDAHQQAFKLDKAFTPVELSAEAFLRNPVIRFDAEAGKTIFYKALFKFPRLDYAKSGHTKGWKVWKTIENMDGTDVIKVGDIVKVNVHFEATNERRDHDYQYFVVDDPLPAGFVAINGAIKTEEQVVKPSDESKDELYNGEDDTWNFVPNYQEIRDDRVVGFKNHFYWWGTYKFSYYARAITEGEFVLPATKVQLMYSPDISGFTPVSKIDIQAR
ncbi:MAG TPA: hypothetical protein EYO37_08125 [Nitrospina sp.]|nr:hypothetical protein [Nitrospina sp.]